MQHETVSAFLPLREFRQEDVTPRGPTERESSTSKGKGPGAREWSGEAETHARRHTLSWGQENASMKDKKRVEGGQRLPGAYPKPCFALLNLAHELKRTVVHY